MTSEAEGPTAPQVLVVCNAREAKQRAPLIGLGGVAFAFAGLAFGLLKFKSCRAWCKARKTQNRHEAASTTESGPTTDPTSDGATSKVTLSAPMAVRHNTLTLAVKKSKAMFKAGETRAMIIFQMCQVLSEFTAIIDSTGDSGSKSAYPEPSSTFAAGLGVANFDLLSYVPVGCANFATDKFYEN